MFEGMLDEPARAAPDQAALDLTKKATPNKPKLGGNGNTNTNTRSQTPADSPAALSSNWTEVKFFYTKNEQADLESTHDVRWKDTEGQWVKTRLNIC